MPESSNGEYVSKNIRRRWQVRKKGESVHPLGEYLDGFALLFPEEFRLGDDYDPVTIYEASAIVDKQPELGLLLAIIERSYFDLHLSHAQYKREAASWFISDNDEPFSLDWILEQLNATHLRDRFRELGQDIMSRKNPHLRCPGQGYIRSRKLKIRGESGCR